MPSMNSARCSAIIRAMFIASLTSAFVSGGMLGFYELDRTTVVVLLAIITFLIYHFYWRPIHAASSELRSPPTPRARRTTLLSTS